MKVAPVLIESNASSGSVMDFRFTDDPDWRVALKTLTLYINGVLYNDAGLTDFNHIGPGRIATDNFIYSSGLTFKWIFQADGYDDVTVTVVIP